MNRPRLPRVKPSPRFLRTLGKLDQGTQKAAGKALTHFMQNPDLKGLNFEPLQGRDGFWKIRVNDNFRILLEVRDDESGRYYLVADIAKHDVYKKRR